MVEGQATVVAVVVVQQAIMALLQHLDEDQVIPAVTVTTAQKPHQLDRIMVENIHQVHQQMAHSQSKVRNIYLTNDFVQLVFLIVNHLSPSLCLTNYRCGVT